VLNNGGTGSPLGPWLYLSGRGFTVSNGSIIGAFWNGNALNGEFLYVLSFNSFLTSNGDRRYVGSLQWDGQYVGGPLTVIAEEQPQPGPISGSSVPGPLPLFGAAAAFGFSRKLRNRIKVTRTTAPTPPAG
jgi:hypothetical protein